MKKYEYPAVTELGKQLPFFLVGVGCDWEQEPIHRPFGYPNYIWLQTVSGSGTGEIAGTSMTLGPSHGILIPPNVAHHYRNVESSPWIVHWLTFGGWQLEELTELLNIKSVQPISLRLPEELSAEMRIALRNAQESFPHDLENSAIIYRIITRIAMELRRMASGDCERRDVRLQAVLDYINLNYSSVVTIDGLASIAEVSPQHLCRMFRDQLSCRPFEHINRVRISKSKTLMISDTDRRIKDIALACGFEHESYFAGVFRRIEGISPKEFRSLHAIDRQVSFVDDSTSASRRNTERTAASS